jgi:hypothetical protein
MGGFKGRISEFLYTALTSALHEIGYDGYVFGRQIGRIGKDVDKGM